LRFSPISLLDMRETYFADKLSDKCLVKWSHQLKGLYVLNSWELEGSSGRPKPRTPRYNRKPDGVPFECGWDPQKRCFPLTSY